MDRLFLDANVLFSAAWREGAGVARLWSCPGAELVTSAYASEEARRNLESDEKRGRLSRWLESVRIVPEAPEELIPEVFALRAKDRPILAAAIAAGATHLITGDRRDFGLFFGHRIGALHVMRPADYLRS